MPLLNEFLAKNQEYAKVYAGRPSRGPLPSKKVAVVTCMDCRMEPDDSVGLSFGEAHFIRNAGGRVTEDAVRSLVVSWKLLGTEEIYVVHHTACGMGSVTDEQIAQLLEASLSPAKDEGNGYTNTGSVPGRPEGRSVKWGTISTEPDALVADVKTLRDHPLIPGNIPIFGLMFDTDTGVLSPIAEAIEAGFPRQDTPV